MNERIRALANQAHEYALGMYDTRIATEGQSNVLFYQIRDDKFAELIVRECVDLCNKEAEFAGSNGRKDASASNCADTIKQHFGVEL